VPWGAGENAILHVAEPAQTLLLGTIRMEYQKGILDKDRIEILTMLKTLETSQQNKRTEEQYGYLL
jgi:hypothetical protein